MTRRDASSTRDYDAIASAVASALADPRASRTRDARMQAIVDALWPALAPTGVSWLGFYLHVPGEPDDRCLVLGPREPKPACSPIGLHGVCGQSFLARAPRIVHDVATLGPNYIACDPRDRSEVVVPCIDRDGTCWGVLDLDSHDVGSFDERDAVGLAALLMAAAPPATDG